MRLPGSTASVGWDALAAQLLCLEWMPYHSQTFGATRLRLPSRDYTRSLALESIKKDALFVLMRARELWLELVPELTTANVIELKNARRTYVSTGNMADEFDEVAGRITAEIRRVRTAAPARPTIRKRPKN